MQLFIDSASLPHIREAASWGVIDGVTTNPTLLAKSGHTLKEAVAAIGALIDGPISAECMQSQAGPLHKEAREIASLHPGVVVKIPLTREGLKCVKALSQEGIATNVTLCFSAAQGLLAAKAGATYVSIFMGRLDDTGQQSIKVVAELVQIYRTHQFATKVLAASIRNPKHVIDAALAGAHAATAPYATLKQLAHHPLTDSGMAQFLADWQNANEAAKSTHGLG